MLLQGIHSEDLAGRILEPVLAAVVGAERTHSRLGRVRITGILEVLQLLEFLELLVVSNMCVIGRQTHQVVHQAQDHKNRRDCRQDEHYLGLLHIVLAEEFHLLCAADLHFVDLRVVREHKAYLE